MFFLTVHLRCCDSHTYPPSIVTVQEKKKKDQQEQAQREAGVNLAVLLKHSLKTVLSKGHTFLPATAALSAQSSLTDLVSVEQLLCGGQLLTSSHAGVATLPLSALVTKTADKSYEKNQIICNMNHK